MDMKTAEEAALDYASKKPRWPSTLHARAFAWADRKQHDRTVSASSGPPGPCITPSTETCAVVVSFMVEVPLSLVRSGLLLFEGVAGNVHVTFSSSPRARGSPRSDQCCTNV